MARDKARRILLAGKTEASSTLVQVLCHVTYTGVLRVCLLLSFQGHCTRKQVTASPWWDTPLSPMHQTKPGGFVMLRLPVDADRL